MKDLKLNKLNRSDMKQITGGETPTYKCSCGCQYANQGGSSTNDNCVANAKNGLKSEYEKEIGFYYKEEGYVLLW